MKVQLFVSAALMLLSAIPGALSQPSRRYTLKGRQDSESKDPPAAFAAAAADAKAKALDEGGRPRIPPSSTIRRPTRRVDDLPADFAKAAAPSRRNAMFLMNKDSEAKDPSAVVY